MLINIVQFYPKMKDFAQFNYYSECFVGGQV